MKKYSLPEPPKGPNKETYYKWAKDVGKYMNQYFPHVDLSSPKNLCCLLLLDGTNTSL